jgi:CubicO group peptidase (beta-lactamase class C family)
MEDFAHGRNVTPLPNNIKTFDWHTKLKDLLPNDWKLMDHWASEKATVRDILSHMSGLYKWGSHGCAK